MNNIHLPVMINECIQMLNIKPNGVYVDCTTGRGGHTSKILSYLNNQGKIICLDIDQEAIDYLNNKFAKNKNVIIIKSNFSKINDVLSSLNIEKVDGIIADLGVSSPMFDDSDRGFSYHKNGRLDMRMNQDDEFSAYDIINNYSEQQLNRIFKNYGEIARSKKVVAAIIKNRKIKPIETTSELVDLIKANVDKKELFKTKHPARLYFQALRIETNHELDNLKKLLSNGINYLKKDGRFVFITFHSLEDRIVKQFFNNIVVTHIPKEVPIMNTKTDFELINKKPILPSVNEINTNNRARSAKLRGVRRVN